jgi:uncharacterized membrane protein HdeD (DUF308 family)
MNSRLSRPARTQATALVVAAVGIVVQIIAGPFAGTWIEIAAIAVALVAGIAALIAGSRHPALSR